MRMMSITIFSILCMLLNGCQKEELTYSSGDLQVEIVTGENWLHDFPLFAGFTKKSPQFAIWLEDTAGNYLSTVFVTYKTATQGWVSSKGNRRKESLPHWAHQRGFVYGDGLMLPDKKHPLPDGITGATPKEGKTIRMRINDFDKPIVVKAEFNHSIDFNSFFPRNAKEGDWNYSGGDYGSGQPAVVYAITLSQDSKLSEMQLVGRSSADGSDGKLYNDLEKLTSAKCIINKVIVSKR
ncbi:MAG: hypothetical protein HC905_01835 [Bacteroidales bacterium]|nr:hypothetical protein [Bacteroidales bacterium]